MEVLNCNGKVLDLQVPHIMGIVNTTPDSFYRGSRYEDLDRLLNGVETMINDGASIIDIGGQSSRPRAEKITAFDEWSRIKDAIIQVRQRFPDIILSVDTYYSEVVNYCHNEGVDMINDISAGSMDPNMLQSVGDTNMAYVLMHMLGTPKTMQDDPNYKNLILDIITFLKAKISKLHSFGKFDIMIDPGFGFGKQITDNYEILRKLDVFRLLDVPILIGLSRKSMIYKVLQIESGQALNGTTALHMAALLNGASVLRVHDVSAAKEVVTLYQNLTSE